MSTSPSEGEHIVVVCDGNRTFEVNELGAQGTMVGKDSLSPEQLYDAYKKGGDAMKAIIEAARDAHVGLIAAWTWSTKNWSRPQAHADAVFQVTTEFLLDLEQNWIDLPENEDVRLVHGGRPERLQQSAPEMMQVLNRVCDRTRKRAGMVVALLMDHSGPDEEQRAREMWAKRAQICRSRSPYQDFLDLPWQGVPYKELDLRIRTGETGSIRHMNAVMSGYTGMETRDVYHAVPLPLYTSGMFLRDLQNLRETEKRRGA